ncbi:thioesterase II family protein [Streptomyces sp. NPDC018610]|uniref:thioesterase II family protein n=1 Tax=Streptomyces sp. NPDC018610 TaxID=3365049 RepID=UPI0037AB1740
MTGHPAARPASGPSPYLWSPTLRRTGAVPARARLLVAPHSGAGPNSLLPLLAAVPADVEIVGLCLPGRERRFGESPGCGLGDVLRGVHDELMDRDPLPTVCFGHSLGALLAVRIAALLGDSCVAAIPSGQLPGREERPAHSASSDTDLIALLVSGEGTPAHLLNDPQLRRLLLHVLRADLELSREAAEDFDEVRLAAPLFVLGGDADALAPAERLPLWAAHTEGVCELELLPGGHFALLEERNRDRVARLLTRALETCRAT